MRKQWFSLLACCCAFAAGSNAGAGPRSTAPPPQAFVLESGSRPLANRWLAPDAIEEFRVQVDPEAVAANPRVLAIDLPDGSHLEAVRTRFVVYAPDWKNWSGTLRYLGEKGPGSGYVNFGLHGTRLTAYVDFAGERYRIVDTDEGNGPRLVRLSADLSPPPCGVVAGTEDEISLDWLIAREKTSGKKAATGRRGAKVATTRIDVLVVYPRAFFTQSASIEASIRTFAQDSISMANDVFFNNGINAAYNLVGVVPLIGASQPAGSGLLAGLRWVNTSGGNGTPAPEVTSLRNAFGADVVTMFIPFEWNSDLDRCGVAIVPTADGSFTPRDGFPPRPPFPAFADRAFTTIRLNCGLGDFTVAHEIGHNYGMRHDNDTSTDLLFSYGRGYIFPPDAPAHATVMGCVCTGCFCDDSCTLGPGAVCNRIPYFSDPTRTYQGQPIGTSDRNNAQVGRLQVPVYAGFRAESTNTPPNANFTQSCANLTCTFDASTSSDDAAIPSTGYWWDFGDGTTDTGQSRSHTYTTQVAPRVHLVVTDGGGQTDVEWQPGQGTAPATPTALTATANGTTQINLTWTASAGATSYEVQRSSEGGSYLTVGTPTTNSFPDSFRDPGKTYVYIVRARNAAGASGWSAPDLATTFLFTEDPATAGGTVKLVHLTELRQAVNMVRAAAGLAAATFTDPAPSTSTPIRAVHLSELRSALDPARSALRVPALTYTDPTLSAGMSVKAAHVQELRNGVK